MNKPRLSLTTLMLIVVVAALSFAFVAQHQRAKYREGELEALYIQTQNDFTSFRLQAITLKRCIDDQRTIDKQAHPDIDSRAQELGRMHEFYKQK